METVRIIDEYIRNNKESILSDLMELASVPSVQSAAEPGKPFGAESRRALDMAVRMFGENSFEARVYSDGKYGLAHSGEGKKEIGVFAHCDVVPVEADKWIYTKPFEPILKNGYVIGRGVHDNKAGVVMALYALRALRDCNIKVNSKLTVFLGANEENGMQDITAYREEQKIPDFSIVPDNAYPICLGEKGIYHLFAKCRTPFTDILDFSGGLAVNVVLGEAEAKLRASAALKDELYAFCSSKKEYSLSEEQGILTLRAYGITAHCSRPQRSLNAAKLICTALLSCTALNCGDRAIVSDIAYLLSDDSGKQFGIECADPHFRNTTTANGIVKTEDGHFCLSFDIRYGTVIDSQVVESRVVDTLRAHGFMVVSGDNREGFTVDEDSAAVKSIIEAYKQISGIEDCRPYYSGGGTYARYIKNAISIGCEASYVPHSEIEMPAGHGEVHQSDEMISIEGLLESIKLLAVMICRADEAISDK